MKPIVIKSKMDMDKVNANFCKALSEWPPTPEELQEWVEKNKPILDFLAHEFEHHFPTDPVYKKWMELVFKENPAFKKL